MEAKLSPDRKSLRVSSPPNNRVYPPGPGVSASPNQSERLLVDGFPTYLAWIYVTVDDVSSAGVQVMVGNGRAPPVEDQGVRLAF